MDNRQIVGSRPGGELSGCVVVLVGNCPGV